MTVYRTLRPFLKDKIAKIVQERGRIKPDYAIFLFEKEFSGEEGFRSLTSIPSYLLLSWILADERIGIDDGGYLVPLTEGADDALKRILDMVEREGVVTLREVSEELGMRPREASKLLASLTREGILVQARVHDVLSEVPRLISAYGRGPDRGQLIHRYAKKVLRELTGAEEEVRMGRWVYDLANDDLIIEVVCTPLNEARGMELREKLSVDGRTKYAIYYTNRRRDLGYLRRSVEGHLRGLDVKIYSLFDAVSIFRGSRHRG